MYTPKERLMRSRSERIIAGVAGGIAQYLSIDPVITRLAFIALMFTGVGVLLYPILWVIMPQEGAQKPAPEQAFDEMQQHARRVEDEVRVAFDQRRPRYDSGTGAPLDSEFEVPINNLGDQPAAEAAGAPTSRQRQVGILLLGIGVMIVLSMVIGPMFGKLLFPIVLIGAGILMLQRQRA
jgi:phage shock protein C